MFRRGIQRAQSWWWLARLRVDAWLAGGRLEIASTIRLRTRVVFRGRGTVRIGEHTILRLFEAGLPGRPIFLNARHAESWIAIGARSQVANGAEMIAQEWIEVGRGALISAGARIFDSDFHGVERARRLEQGRTAPVRIGEDVWIGISAIVLKGVSIGDGAVIGAGSVIRSDVSSGAVVSGHPAQVLKVYA